MPRGYHILVINPGSTSTKLALFRNGKELRKHTARHDARRLAAYRTVMEQEQMRLAEVRGFLAACAQAAGGPQAAGAPLRLDAVAARGGLLHPVEGGVYRVNRAMQRDLRSGRYGEHASNLGAVLGAKVGEEHGCPVFIADPVVVDELEPAARLSGLPQIPRKSIFHALNQKAAAREAAARMRREYERCNLIVAHLGGGISVGAHRRGRVVDVNNALDGEGPFSPERSGGLPAGQLARLCFSGEYTEPQVLSLITGRGGVVAYCGTNSMEELEERAGRGDRAARLCMQAMCRQVAQEICRHGATLRGEVDCIVLTGGMTRSRVLVGTIRGMVRHLAPVKVIAGEREMQALAGSVYQVLRGAWKAKRYAS
ncbi:MAG: butyrate kinase [Spirochaetota bacterium]